MKGILLILFPLLGVQVLAQKSRIVKFNEEEYVLVDSRNEKILRSNKYDHIVNLEEDIYKARKGDVYGLINHKGKELTEFKFLHIQSYSDGLIGAQLYDKKIDAQELEGDEYISVESAKQMIESMSNKWGFINKSGETVISFKYDDYNDFSEGLAVVLEKGIWILINKKGEKELELNYSDFNSFKEGVLGVRSKENKKWGAVNRKGEVLIPFLYSDFSNFSEGLVAVEQNNKWGVINKKGKVVIPIEYNYVYDFKNGKAKVESKEKVFYINRKGKRLNE